MRFKYRDYRHKNDPSKVAYRPMIPVRLGYGGRYQAIWALIDSGSELCLVHSSVGKILGIDVDQGLLEIVSGISGHHIAAYMDEVHVIVPSEAGVDLEIGFTDSDGIKDGGLLGQHGFFEESHPRRTQEVAEQIGRRVKAAIQTDS